METITRNVIISELMEKYPQVEGILLSYGLYCVGCPVAAQESLGDGAKAHGLDDKTIDQLVFQLNEAIAP